jgi:hypothetical protein
LMTVQRDATATRRRHHRNDRSLHLRDAVNVTLCKYTVRDDVMEGRVPRIIRYVRCVDSGCRCKVVNHIGTYTCTQLVTNMSVTIHNEQKELTGVPYACVCASQIGVEASGTYPKDTVSWWQSTVLFDWVRHIPQQHHLIRLSSPHCETTPFHSAKVATFCNTISLDWVRHILQQHHFIRQSSPYSSTSPFHSTKFDTFINNTIPFDKARHILKQHHLIQQSSPHSATTPFNSTKFATLFNTTISFDKFLHIPQQHHFHSTNFDIRPPHTVSSCSSWWTTVPFLHAWPFPFGVE